MSARDDQDNESRGSDKVVRRGRSPRRGSLLGSMQTHKEHIDPAPAPDDDCIFVVQRRAGPQNQRMQGQDQDKEDQLQGEDARFTYTQQADSEDSDIAPLAGSRHRQRAGGLAAEDDDQDFDVKSDGPSTTNTTQYTNKLRIRRRRQEPQVFIPRDVQHQDRLEIWRGKERAKRGPTQASVREDGSNPRDPSVGHNNQQQLPDEMEIDIMSSLPEPSAGCSGTALSRAELTSPPPPASSSLSAAPATSLARREARRSSTLARHSSGDTRAKTAATRHRKRRDKERDLGTTLSTVSMADDPPAQVLISSGSESDIPLITKRERRRMLAGAMSANQPGSEPCSVAGQHAPPSTTSYVATDHTTDAARIRKLEEDVASLRQMVESFGAGSTGVSGDASEHARNKQRLKRREDDLVRALEESETALVSVVSPEEGDTHNPLFQAGETHPWGSPPQLAAQSREVIEIDDSDGEVIVIDDSDEPLSAVPQSQVGDASAGQSTVSPDLGHHGHDGPTVQTSDILSTSTVLMPLPGTGVPSPNWSHGLVLNEVTTDEDQITSSSSRAPQSSVDVPAATSQMPQGHLPFGGQHAHPNQPEQPRVSYAAQQTSNAYTGNTSWSQAIRDLPQISPEQPYSMMSQSNLRRPGPSPATGGSSTHTVQNFFIVTQEQANNYLNSMPGSRPPARFPQDYTGVANAPAQLQNSSAQRPGRAGNSRAGRSMQNNPASLSLQQQLLLQLQLNAHRDGRPAAQGALSFASVPSSRSRGPGSAIGSTGSRSVVPPRQNTGHFEATIGRPTLPSANQTPQGSQGSIPGQPSRSQNTRQPGSGPGPYPTR